MPQTNFPGGVGLYGIPTLGTGTIYDVPPSRVWFVCNRSGVTSGDGTTRDRPLLSIADAIANISTTIANNSEWIVVLAGHAENVTASNTFSGSLVNTGAMTIPRGTRIIGQGTGSSRPTLTLTAAGSTLALANADCTLENLVILCPQTATTCTVGVTVTAADTAVRACRMQLGSTANGLFGTPIQLSSAANFFQATDNFCFAQGSGTPTSWLATTGTTAAVGVFILRNFALATLSSATGALVDLSSASGTAPVAWDISENKFGNLATNSTVALKGVASASGFAIYNALGITNATGGAAAFNTPGNLFSNQTMGTVRGANAILTPAASG